METSNRKNKRVEGIGERNKYKRLDEDKVF